MKWIGQHIINLIARFRSDVYLEDIDTGTIASGGNLGLDSNNKIVKATVSSGSGDMTGVDLTGTLPIVINSEANTTSGDYSSTIGINTGNGILVNGSGDLVTNDSEIDHDSLDNFVAAEHFTQANITTVGTIGTGVWQGTAIASAYLDSDTAHLSGNQTFSGLKTFSTGGVFNKGINSTGNRGSMLSDGTAIHVDAMDVTDESTSASGTAASFKHVSIETPRLMATNAAVTTTDAVTLYIKGAPLASTNQTITNAYSLFVDAGDVKFDSDLYLDGTLRFDSASISAIQASSETFADNNTSLMTSAAIEDKIQTTLPKKSLHYVHGDLKDTGSDMTNEHFISLGDADRENTNELGVAIPIIIPGTGVLKRVIKRTQSDFSAKTWSYKFFKAPSGTALGSASLMATVTKNAGGAANTNSIIDFTTDASDAANACTFETGFTTSTQFNAGDSLLFSYQCTSGSGPSGTPKIIWTLVFELDDTTAY